MHMIYVRYTRVDAKFHIVYAVPGNEKGTPALCGHRWGRWMTEAWRTRPDPGHNWCRACLKAEQEMPHA